MSESKFYTVKEFAYILDAPEYIILQWINEDVLEYIEIDNIAMIPESELERLLNGLESKSK